MSAVSRADEIRRRCRRFVSYDRPPLPSRVLAELADYAGNSEADKYNAGELFDRLEGRVAQLLGKEAALFLPSGKLAQMAALRCLTDRSGCRRVAMHPRSHFEEYESRAYQELWGMTAAAFGGYDRLPVAADLESIKEALGAATIEMPLRRLGCLLNSWEQIAEISAVARRRGIPLHLDGARIWESQPYYGRPLDEIAGLFDSVYVAFDKGIGALAGGALAGPRWLIDQARYWQRRAGGRALRSFPYILSALKGLDEGLPRMADFHGRAVDIAVALRGLPRVRVSPDPPHVNAFLVAVDGDQGLAKAVALDVAESTGVWLFEESVDVAIQGLTMFEITVRGGAFELEVNEIREIVGQFSDLLWQRSQRKS